MLIVKKFLLLCLNSFWFKNNDVCGCNGAALQLILKIHYGTKKLRTPKDFLKSNANIK